MLSPVGWTVLAVMQALAAWVFLVRLDVFAAVQPRLPQMPGAPGLTALVVTPLFRTMALVYMLVVPVVTMNSIGGERHSGTLPLLLSAPVDSIAIVAGKYLAVLVFLLAALAMVTTMPIALLHGGSLDFGLLAASLLGMSLLVAAFAAAGLFFSTLSPNPATAAVTTTGFLLLLWLLDWAMAAQDGGAVSALYWLSPTRHLDAMLRGLVDTSDVAYFVLFIAVFLTLGVRRLEAERRTRR